MPTLTPQHRSGEATWAAMKDGLVSGSLALIPCGGALWLAMKNPKFVKATNWQSRTALVVMPTLFAFGFASESTLNHKMMEMAHEADHSKEMAVYTTVNRKDLHDSQKTTGVDPLEAERQLQQLYRQSVENSGVRVVPTMKPWHHAANFWQENPFKILAGLGVPTIAYIFYGRSGQEHIPFQLKVMQTRVMGQASIIVMLLGLMGFKEYMDRNGKFITEAQAEERVSEMRRVRAELIHRMELEKQYQQELKHAIEEAHEQDVQDATTRVVGEVEVVETTEDSQMAVAATH